MTKWQTCGFGEVPGEPGVFCACDPLTPTPPRGLYYRCPVCGTRWLRGTVWPRWLLARMNRRTR